MLVRFNKMHSIGNDFVVIDLITQPLRMNSKIAKKIANRHLGVGCDQVITVEPPEKPEDDFSYKVFNTDGSIAKQCINGARCAAMFMHDYGYTNKSKLKASCASGNIEFEILDNRQVKASVVNIQQDIYEFEISKKGFTYKTHYTEVKNPHAVIFIDSLKGVYVSKQGKIISKSREFPQNPNVSFIQIKTPDLASIRTYENGVGTTYACGSASLAAFIIGYAKNKFNHRVTMEYQLGQITIEKVSDCINITSEVNSVFGGMFEYDTGFFLSTQPPHPAKE